MMLGLYYLSFGIQTGPLQMHYFSTNRAAAPATFAEAVLAGQPDDRGLYFPSEIPKLDADLVARLHEMSNAEIAFDVIRPYVNGEIPDDDLFRISSDTVDFEFPVVPVTERIAALELFHGPTLAFKDVGARFMSRCLGYFEQGRDGKTIVVVATSGDTGGAVAAGFHNVEGIEVVILYPKGRVSNVQEQQLTTLGGNVTTLELHGTFDDCQALAKRALADSELRQKARLTSANSINVARWLPQQFYYFFALKQWHGEPPVFSVPSGNFGNLASGVLAARSGLPVKHFIAACNANDVVPRLLESGKYEPRDTIPTLSNAMDVGAPSNFVRILEMFGGDIGRIKAALTAVRVDDTTTAETMRQVHRKFGYILDPHGAVAYRGAADHLERHPDDSGIFLETAHPVKFDSVEEIIGRPPVAPDGVKDLASKEKYSIVIENDYDAVRQVILEKV